MNAEQIKGQWNQVTGRLREHWGQLTDNDFHQLRGNADQLVGMVQAKTGATRAEVEKLIDSMLEEGQSVVQQISGTASHYAEVAVGYASNAGEYLRDAGDVVSSKACDYSARVADTVRSRPAESLAIAFGLGLAVGALLVFNRK